MKQTLSYEMRMNSGRILHTNLNGIVISSSLIVERIIDLITPFMLLFREVIFYIGMYYAIVIKLSQSDIFGDKVGI